MDIALTIASAACIIIGIVGCFIPAIPGPLLAYGGVVLMFICDKMDVSTATLIITGIITLLITIMDYLLPAKTTKSFGGSKWGSWGSLAGMLVGMLFPPIGFIVGSFIGAVAFEMFGGKDFNSAMKSGLGSLIGFMLSTGIKLVFCLFLLIYFAVKLVGWIN